MDAIGTIIRSARRRMMLRDAVARATSSCIAAGAALLVLLVAARFLSGFVPVLGLPLVAWCAFVLAGAAVALWVALGMRRPSDLAVSSVVDVELGLHDRLSTAIAVTGRSDPFAKAAIEDGVKVARDPRVREGLSRACPVPVPARSAAGPALFALAAAAWLWMPAMAPRAGAIDSGLAQEELAAARAAAAAQLEPVIRQIEANESLAQALSMPTEQDGDLVGQGRDGQSAEDVRREAARRMTELTQRLDQLMQSPQAQQLDALRDALSRIEPSPGSPTQSLAEALKRGDAAAARKELESLASRGNDPTMDAATREALAKSLEQLASQVEKAATGNDALQKALERSGMDPALASNPAALDQAIAQSDQLNDAQKESIRQAAQAQRNANESLQKLAQSMGSCAGQCRNPSQGDSGGAPGSQGGQSPGQDGSPSGSQPTSVARGGEMLSEMEQLSQMLQDAQAARSQCSGGGQPTQLANSGASSPSGSVGQGRGMQGGRSVGGNTPTQETAFGTKSRKEKVANQGGDVIARQLVDAPPVVGESRAKLQQIAQEMSRGVEEGTGDDPVPPHLREAHRRYFGEMRRRIEQKTGSQAP
jgi:hypothetical protein